MHAVRVQDEDVALAELEHLRTRGAKRAAHHAGRDDDVLGVVRTAREKRGHAPHARDLDATPHLVEAGDLDEALALAKQIPMPAGGVEVRPIRTFD